ncbi:MAG: RagB/SusD family nutrient uptake outer membrane protein [Adhaeribacter sp.]
MKKNKILITGLLFLSLGLGACHQELLEPNPESLLTTANFFNSAKDMDQAVLGVYSRMQARKPGDYLLLEVPTDNLYLSSNTSVAGAPELDVLAPTSANPLLNNFWISNYNIIFRANSVLNNIDKPTDYKAAQKDQFIGEAKFMRALTYFDLVRVFGGVPKVTVPLSRINESRRVPRNSEEEIYNLIIEDLKDAIAKLPVQTGIARGRASKAAAVALLGKVYVYRKDWPNAKTYLEQLFRDFNYSLVPNFANLWKLTTEDNSEVIFALKYVEGTNGHSLSTDFIPNAGAPGVVDRGAEVALPSWSLHKKYEEGDTRKAATITEMWRAPNRPNDPLVWLPYISKYAVPHTYGASGLDLPVLRLADMILLYAETLYELNQPDQALEQLNKVRERAFGDASHNYTATDIPNREAFIDQLLLERQLEFAYENERWFDLMRTGRYTTVMTAEERIYNNTTKTPLVVTLAPKAFHKYLPIPLPQIDQAAPDVLAQNEGY